MSSHRTHLVLADWHSRLHGLWDRLGVALAGTRRGEERLSVALDELQAVTDNLARNHALLVSNSHDVLRLLYRHRGPAAGGLGCNCTACLRARPEPRAVSREGGTSEQQRITERINEARRNIERGFVESAGHFATTTGSPTVTFGPYDAEDFAPRQLSDCE